MKKKKSLREKLFKSTNKSITARIMVKSQKTIKMIISKMFCCNLEFRFPPKTMYKTCQIIKFRENGKKKWKMFWRKKASINFQLSTIETWLNSLCAYFQNTWSCAPKIKNFLRKWGIDCRESWKRTALAWKTWRHCSVDKIANQADNFWQRF